MIGYFVSPKNNGKAQVTIFIFHFLSQTQCPVCCDIFSKEGSTGRKMDDDQQQQLEDKHDNLETLRTDTTSTGSVDEQDEGDNFPPAPPPEASPPVIMQPQIAFLANAIGDSGGPMTGSFVLLPPPSSSSVMATNNENSTTSETNRFQNDDPPNREPRHHQHHHRLDAGNMDPLPALFSNPTTDSYAPYFPATSPNPLQYSAMVPIGQPLEPQQTTSTSNNGESTNIEEETNIEASIDKDTQPVRSYRSRQRKRDEKKEKQRQAKKKEIRSSHYHRVVLPPHHRATNTQVWNTSDMTPLNQQQVRRRQNITLPPQHRTTKTQVWDGGERGRGTNAGESSVPQVVVLNGVPILYASSISTSNSTPSVIFNGGQPTTAAFDPRGQFTAGIPPHRRTDTTDTTDTNIALVGHEIVSGDSSNPYSLPSVHYVRGGADRLRCHVHDFVRDSRRMEVVNYEQIERIKMMHDRFAEGSKFSFNYNTLLLTASVIAGLGLASNSTTTVIASMLVSPIMGPVVGMAYGATIHDFRLFKTAAITEIVSLLFCIFMGMVLGGCMGATDLAEAWPTDEMHSRGTWQNFFVALPVAFFSGLGVAVGLLDDQVSSLVGVAISASLLPPAVNSGILWVSYAFFEKNWWHGYVPEEPVPPQEREDTYYDPVAWSYEYDIGCDRHKADIIDNASAYYRCYFRKSGWISLLLTIANIVLVAIASMIMFRMKERLPIPSKKVFWEDLGTARKIYRNLAVMSQAGSEVSSQHIDGNSDSSSKNKSESDQLSEVRRHIDPSIPEGNEEEDDNSSNQNDVRDLEP